MKEIEELINKIDLLYNKYYDSYNFIYIFTKLIDEYFKYKQKPLDNNIVLTAITKSSINKKYSSILQEYYQPQKLFLYYEFVIKNFIENKNQDINTFLSKYKSNDYIKNILEKVKRIEIKDDVLINYQFIKKQQLRQLVSIPKIVNPTTINRIIESDNMYSYLCYYKATINFFLTNSIYLKQYRIEETQLISTDSPADYSIINDIDSIITENKYYGGDVFSNEFFNTITSSYHIKDIKRFLDDYLPNFKHCYPGIIHYPAFLINNIINRLNDNLTINSSFLNFSNKLSFSYDKNIVNDIIKTMNEKIKVSNLDENNFRLYDKMKKDFLNKHRKNLKITITNNEDVFINKFKSIKHTKDLLLIHTPINALTDLYVYDNFKRNNLSFDEIYLLCKAIKCHNNIRIKYPFHINNYSLDSFIICINRGTLDCHFSFIKRINDKFKLMDTMNYNMKSSTTEFVKNEYNYIIKDNYVYDNLTYKVVFVSYVKEKIN